MPEVAQNIVIDIDLEEEMGEERLIQAFRQRKARWRRFGDRYKVIAPYVIVGGTLVLLLQNPAFAGLWFLATFGLRVAVQEVGLGLELHSHTVHRNMFDTAKLAEKCGLLTAMYVEPEKLPTYIKIADEDPELACAGLRIEIERRLCKLARLHGICENRLCMVITALGTKGVFTRDQLYVLNNLRQRLNSAVHGNVAEKGTNEWLRLLGPRLVARLDELIKQAPSTSKYSAS
jgi:hypothetical protein